MVWNHYILESSYASNTHTYTYKHTHSHFTSLSHLMRTFSFNIIKCSVWILLITMYYMSALFAFYSFRFWLLHMKGIARYIEPSRLCSFIRVYAIVKWTTGMFSLIICVLLQESYIFRLRTFSLFFCVFIRFSVFGFCWFMCTYIFVDKWQWLALPLLPSEQENCSGDK